MNPNKMLLAYINKDEGHKKIKGRYWASDLYSIIKGYITPENYLKEKKIDLYGTENIIMGYAIEEYLNKIFVYNKADCEYQAKRELKITDDITLVVKPDFNLKSQLIELKFPDSPMKDEIPDKWAFQLEAEYRAFEKPVWLAIVRKHPLLSFVPFKPSTMRWNNIKKALMDFNSKL